MIYLLYIPLAILCLVFGIGAIYRAWSRAVPRVYWQVGFWLLLTGYFVSQFSGLLYLSGVCLAFYWFITWQYGSKLAARHESLRQSLGKTGEPRLKWFKAAALGEAESRRKVEAKNMVSTKQEQEKAQKAVVKSKRIALDFKLPAPERYTLESGGFLTLETGPIHLDVLLQIVPGQEELNIVKVTTSLADVEGNEFRSTSYMPLRPWLEELENDREFTLWDKAPIGWNKAIWWSTQISSANETMDSRDRRILKISGQAYDYLEKHQGPNVDIAWVESELAWVVRISDLYRDLANLSPDSREEDEKIPSFAWTVPGLLAALPVHPELHFTTVDEAIQMPNHQRPIVFSRTGKKLAPQPGVKAVPA